MVSPFPLTRSAVPCTSSQMEEHSIMLIQVVSIRSLCCPLKPCEYEIAKHLPEILNCLTLWRRWHCCWSCQPAAIVGCVVVAGVTIAIGCFCLCLFVFWVFLVECWLSYLHDPLAPSMNNYEWKQEYIRWNVYNGFWFSSFLLHPMNLLGYWLRSGCSSIHQQFSHENGMCRLSLFHAHS